jgi:hypothetical protein
MTMSLHKGAARRLVAAAAALGAVFVCALVMSSSAQAAGGCPGGWFCAFPSENYAGNRYQWAESNTNWHQWAIADDDDSWSNMNTTYNVRVFTNTGFGLPCQIRINKGVSKGSSFAWENDDGSSHKRDSATVSC